MSRLLVDADQIRTFSTLLRHAVEGQFISLRTFDDNKNGDKALTVEAVEINGAGLAPVIDAAISQAQWAADHGKRAVFCPPLAGFSSAVKADELHLLAGYTISAECDERPANARKRLETLLGPATLVVASGGVWTDPATKESQPKLHLHWRLAKPATGDDLARLKRARRLAAEFVGADPSNIPVCHPIRWAGSWHRKGEPKLATIVAHTENEVDLDTALAALEAARREKPTPVISGTRDEAGKGQFTVAPLLVNTNPGLDRSRQFQRAIYEAVRIGMTPDQFETLARQYPHGCAAKYLYPYDRLRNETERSWNKVTESAAGERAETVDISDIPLAVARWLSRDLGEPDFFMGDWLSTTSRVIARRADGHRQNNARAGACRARGSRGELSPLESQTPSPCALHRRRDVGPAPEGAACGHDASPQKHTGNSVCV